MDFFRIAPWTFLYWIHFMHFDAKNPNLFLYVENSGENRFKIYSKCIHKFRDT